MVMFGTSFHARRALSAGIRLRASDLPPVSAHHRDRRAIRGIKIQAIVLKWVCGTGLLALHRPPLVGAVLRALSVRRIEIQAVVLKWICGAGLLRLGLQRHCEQANDEGHKQETMHRRILSTFASDLGNPRARLPRGAGSVPAQCIALTDQRLGPHCCLCVGLAVSLCIDWQSLRA